MLMSLLEAKAKLTLPVDVANVNTCQDGVARLREAINLFERSDKRFDRDQVPGYVRTAADNLDSWIEHARARK